MEKIEQILNFVIEIEQLKGVLRKTRPVGFNRYENSAEHSWHVCITALMLKEFANQPVNIDRVIKMLLIHDLGEIDSGDTIVYHSDNAAIKQAEEAGVKRLFALLPEPMAEELWLLWQEFEQGESADAAYAKAIDRVPPLLHNLHGQGHSWQTNNISKQQVFAVNQRIGAGSEALWQVLSRKLDDAVNDGILN